MNDTTTSNIQQLLISFDKFVIILENPSWIKIATAEDIKTAFKLGRFLEKCVAHFRSKDSVSEFVDMLNKWRKTQNLSKVYSEHFFQFACDNLLIKFFRSENGEETTIDIAIRIYTSIFPRQRLQKILNNLLLLSSSYEALTDFAKTSMTESNSKELEHYLKCINWSKLLETGRENIVREEITNHLSLYKIESRLHILIGILSLNDVPGSERLVQNIILEIVLQKMWDRSVLSKRFWLSLFKRVELDYIYKASSNFQDFLKSLFSFIVYVGGMMEKEEDIWKSDATASLCPEISYHDLLVFIKSIYQSNPVLKDFVISALNEAREHTGSSIWDEIKQCLLL